MLHIGGWGAPTSDPPPPPRWGCYPTGAPDCCCGWVAAVAAWLAMLMLMIMMIVFNMLVRITVMMFNMLVDYVGSCR